MLQERKVSDFHRVSHLLHKRSEGSEITQGEIDYVLSIDAQLH